MKKLKIWHPFTQMLTADPPLKVKAAEGVYLELGDGRRLIDCISSWWVNIHGHSHPEIAEAIYDQAQKLEHVIFAGFTHQPAEELAEVLAEELPDALSHMFFSDNGSTALEVALKMSYQYFCNTGQARTKFIVFEGGYHGDTVGAMSLGRGSPFWKKFDPLLFSTNLIPFPETFDGDTDAQERENGSIAAIRKTLEAEPDKFAAICIEPLVQGAAGMRMCRTQFLVALRQLADEFGVLLIFDEVMTGFGRTGDWFACTKAGVNPDIICLSKGITGGFLPLSVTICTSRIYESFLGKTNEKTFFHGHSYTANPLSCAAAVCSWKLLKANQLYFRNLEKLHRQFAAEHLNNQVLIKKIRFCGTIFAADIETNESNNYFHSLGPLLKKRFLERGYVIRPLGNTIYLMPPYCIQEHELNGAYEVIRETVVELHA